MVLEVRDLKTYFHTRRGVVKAVDGVSFSLEKGKTLGLVGESGSGKSVTSHSIMGLVEDPGQIEGGEILLEGESLLERSEKELEKIRGGRISMIFQDPMTSLNPSYSVGYQIKEVLKIHQNLEGEELHQKAIKALEMVAIPSPEERLREYPFRLSGGMRQRVMIAMAMACEPEVLIADEPTTALDVTIQAQILKLMNELKEERDTALLFITHDLAVVSEMADEVAVMYTGKIAEKAPAEELFNNPRHPYTEGLLQSLPGQNQKKKSRLFAIPERVPSPFDLPQGCTFWPRCDYAREMCKKSPPALREVEEGHFSACYKAQGEFE